MKRSQDHKAALSGVSKAEQRIMGRLLRMTPEQHKAAAKTTSGRAEAQRRRRERERQAPTEASRDA
jgi:hypothetical protein